ncbi:hypothetical protein [Burkholderia sp. TSV86]|uniref:hypothetical protein n=1 Tax=Burkholderia sp. TSV86 TaxID=1385594 RepID=UPI0012E36563|nr:hypothetical protein [Burkholderia sp. TSV86]
MSTGLPTKIVEKRRAAGRATYGVINGRRACAGCRAPDAMEKMSPDQWVEWWMLRMSTSLLTKIVDKTGMSRGEIMASSACVPFICRIAEITVASRS